MKRLGGGRSVLACALVLLASLAQAAGGVGRGIDFSSTGVLCLNRQDSRFTADMRQIKNDIATKSTLSAASKKEILPRVVELTVSDYWELREKARREQSDFDAVLRKEYGADKKLETRLGDLESELQARLPVFAKIYQWAGTRVRLGRVEVDAGGKLPFSPRIDLQDRPDCVEIPLAFLIEDSRYVFADSTQSIVDEDLSRLLKDDLNRALLSSHERLAIIAAKVRSPMHPLISFLNRAFLGITYWSNHSGIQFSWAHDAQSVHYDVMTMVGEYPLYLDEFLGDPVLTQKTLQKSGDAFSRAFSYMSLKRQQQEAFVNCLSQKKSVKGSTQLIQVVLCRSESQDVEGAGELSPEMAFLFLSEYRIGYNAEFQESDFSLIPHDSKTPGVESLIDLTGSTDKQLLDQQESLVKDFCGRIEKADRHFRMRREAGLLSGPRIERFAQTYDLAETYCKNSIDH